jgi:integral membrane protein (TIGR01906 family)
MIIRYVLPVITPLFLLMTAIRLLLIPVYPSLEYRTPNFPPDSYGFTFEERVHWSRYAVAYLVNDADISYLGDLTFPDGSPLYNERELSHMVDVKNVVQGMLIAWYVIVAVLIGSGVWAWRTGEVGSFWGALSLGGKLAVAMILLILIGVVVGFRALFTGFHLIFFEGDTWIFLFSDTLIRLFPMRFWQDSFIYVGILTLVGAFVLIWVGRRSKGVPEEIIPKAE